MVELLSDYQTNVETGNRQIDKIRKELITSINKLSQYIEQIFIEVNNKESDKFSTDSYVFQRLLDAENNVLSTLKKDECS